jgi:hypothetical protein
LGFAAGLLATVPELEIHKALVGEQLEKKDEGLS